MNQKTLLVNRIALLRNKIRVRLMHGLVMSLALFAAPAQAGLIQVDYAGVVTDIFGSGFGFSVGSLVSGTMFIDGLAVQSSQCWTGASANCDYFGGNLVHGAPMPAGAQSLDAVYVADNLGFAGEIEADGYYVADGYYLDEANLRTSRYEYVRMFDSLLDLIHGTGIEQDFSLTRDQLTYYANMYGMMAESQTDTLTGQSIFDNSARYDLMYMRVSTVPEPGTMALLGIGLAGLGFSKRRKRG